MGAADLVPGVSGGTIAFISGIYQRLLTALAAFSHKTFWRDLLRFNLVACWRACDATFLAVLFAGILSAVVALSGALHYLLENRAHVLLGFFFGLVAASVVVVAGGLRGAGVAHIAAAIVVAAATAWLVTLSPGGGNASLLFLFGGGVVAISAMLLPGISGSYILLVLGLYPVVITAVHERDLLPLLVFAVGCGTGILLFSRLLSFLLRRWHTMTLSVLVGVMVGAAPKLWPWKENAAGAKIILQPNIAPANYADAPEIGLVLALMVVGAVVVLLIERLARHLR